MVSVSKKMLFFCAFVLIFSHEVFADDSSDHKIVISQDGGADDAMTIFVSLLREQYFNGPQVIGIVTTFGNVDERQAFINTERVLSAIDRRDVPIYRGAKKALVLSVPSNNFYGIDGLGDNKAAVFKPIKAAPEIAALALINLSKQHKDKLIVIVTGPLTSVALAASLDPGFIGRLSHLYIGAGNIQSAQYPDPEFNAQMDTEAFSIITDNATPEKVTFVPFSQVDSLNITKKWRKSVLGSIKTKLIRTQNSFERKSMVFDKSPIWTMLDPVVASIIEDPDSIVKQTKLSSTDVGLCGSERALSTFKFTTNKGQANSKVVYSLHTQAYEAFLIQTFSAQLDNGGKN